MSETIRIVFFPQAAASPVLVAQARGLFKKHRLTARLTPTPDSSHLIGGIIDRHYEFAVALADNFVAYQAGQHTVARKADHDLAIVTGLAKMRASLVVRPEIVNASQLRGQRIGVDGPHAGFTLMLLGLLHNAGLTVDNVQLVRSGSTARRLDELLGGTIDATILTPEFVAVAEGAGFRVCSETEEGTGSCLGMAIGVNRQWAAEHQDAIVRCRRSVESAARWIAKRNNRSKAGGIIAPMVGIPAGVASAEIDRLCDSGDLITDGGLGSLQGVVDLRRRFVAPPLELEPEDLVLEPAAANRPGLTRIV